MGQANHPRYVDESRSPQSQFMSRGIFMTRAWWDKWIGSRLNWCPVGLGEPNVVTGLYKMLVCA